MSHACRAPGFEGEAAAQAFSEGSDARLAGLPLSANPFPSALHWRHSAWNRGWWDVEDHYALEARWPTRELPEVIQG